MQGPLGEKGEKGSTGDVGETVREEGVVLECKFSLSQRMPCDSLTALQNDIHV